MKKILFLGDSITDCEHLYSRDGLGCGYVKMLSEKLPYKLINAGTNGFMTADIRRRINRYLEVKPDFISLLAGVNDIPSIMASSRAYKSFVVSYEEILQKIAETPCLIIAPFIFPSPAEFINWDKILTHMREEIKRLCVKYDVAYLPMDEVFKEELTRTPIAELTTDGIHLTKKGHQILAESWLAKFKEISY